MAEVILISFVSFFLMYLTIGFIQKNDKEHGITFKRKGKFFVLLFLILFSLLKVKYGAALSFYFYSYLTTYLTINAFIDYQTQNVYDFFHYFTIGVGILFLVLNGNLVGNLGVRLIQIFLLALFAGFLVKKGLLGGGDGFLLIALSFFLTRSDVLAGFEVFLFNLLLSNGVFVVSNLRDCNFKKLRMKKDLPFVPSIAISTFIILLVI